MKNHKYLDLIYLNTNHDYTLKYFSKLPIDIMNLSKNSANGYENVQTFLDIQSYYKIIISLQMKQMLFIQFLLKVIVKEEDYKHPCLPKGM